LPAFGPAAACRHGGGDSGEGFDPDPTKNLVTFNGIPAAAAAATTSAVTALVPAAATSGRSV
jgi:hypothetical protein